MDRKLFDNDPDDKEINHHVLKVNKKYAESYNRWRYSEVMSQLKHPSSYDTGSESDSSDGEFVEPNNPEFDEAFLQTLKAVDSCGTQTSEAGSFFKQMPKPDKKKKKKSDTADKPMSVDEYQLKSLFEHQGHEEHEHFRKHEMSQKAKEEILESISAQHQSSGDESDDDLLSSGLFRKKITQTEAQEKDKHESRSDESPVKKALPQKDKSETSQKIPKELLKSKEDTWLFDYFINKRYLGNEDSADIERFYDEVTLDEEDISQKNKMLDCKFKYRFQEPDQDFLKKYPRHIESSVRPRDDKRSRKRETRHIRNEKIKQQKKLEIEKLKAIKKQEIMEKIKQIKEASGNDNLDLADDELDEDFNPEHHDSTMSKAFSNEYYELEGDEHKPTFDYDDDDVIKDYDDWMERHGPFNKDNAEQDESWKDGGDYDGEYDMEENEESGVTKDGGGSSQMSKEAFQKEMLEASSHPKKRRRSKFSWALAKKKPIFNPEEKEFEDYFDEYYQLDFEDIVCGMPCRFKYHKVEPNNFGLDTVEILAASDRDLNQWYSMKKLMRYNRHPNDEKIIRENFSKRAQQTHIKRKYLPSLFADDLEEVQNAEMERRRLKNQKKKLRKQKRAAALLDVASDDHNDSMKNYVSYTQGPNSGSTSPEKNIETTQQTESVESSESNGVSGKNEERSDRKTESDGSLTGSCKSPAKKKKKSHSEDTSIELHAANNISPGKKNKQEMKSDVGNKYAKSHSVTSVNVGKKKADYENKPDEPVETSVASSTRHKEKLESAQDEYYESAVALCSSPKKKEKKHNSEGDSKSPELITEITKESEDVDEWENTYSYDNKIQDAHDGQNANKKSKKKLHKNVSDLPSTEFVSGGNSFKQKESCGNDIPVCNSEPSVILHRSGESTSETQNANNKKLASVTQPRHLESHRLKMDTGKNVHKGKKKAGQHKMQELHTSSINWKDLPPHERVPKLFSGISDLRLKAYGLNPNKTKIKVTYYKKKE